MYKLVFGTNPRDTPEFDKFLTEKLQHPFHHRLGHGGRVIIDDIGEKDAAWKVAEWARHQGPLEKLKYTIIGYTSDLKISYLSYCPLCREGKGPHYEHTKLEKEKGTKDNGG